MKLCREPGYSGAVGRLRGDENGASLLEMTVVAPFLLGLGLGIFEFGNALYQYHLITAGVRDAGRYLAGLPGRDAATRESGKEIAVFGSLTGTNKRVTWWNVEDIDVQYCIDGAEEGDGAPDCACDGALDLRHGTTNKVCIRTTVAYDDLGFLSLLGSEGILASTGLGPITITTDHEERYFGTR